MNTAEDAIDVPQTLVGVSFDDPFRAQEFLTAATGLAARGRLTLKDAVTVAKTEEGKTMVHETIDLDPTRTALSGAVWAGLFGLLLGGPVGWVAGMAVGAGAGVVAAKVVDLGISDEWVAWLRAEVEPGRVVVALLVEELNRDALVQEASRFAGAELVYANLDPGTIARAGSCTTASRSTPRERRARRTVRRDLGARPPFRSSAARSSRSPKRETPTCS